MAELQRRISAAEYYEWAAFAQLEPFGEERADLRAAIVACTVANAFRGKNQKAAQPADFMPDFEPKRRQTQADMAAVMKQFALAHNRFLKNGDNRKPSR